MNDLVVFFRSCVSGVFSLCFFGVLFCDLYVCCVGVCGTVIDLFVCVSFSVEGYEGCRVIVFVSLKQL